MKVNRALTFVFAFVSEWDVVLFSESKDWRRGKNSGKFSLWMSTLRLVPRPGGAGGGDNFSVMVLLHTEVGVLVLLFWVIFIVCCDQKLKRKEIVDSTQICLRVTSNNR